MPEAAPKRLGPKLRDDLVIVEKVRQGERLVVIKDPITMKYFSFGALERTLLGLFDGTNPPPKILEKFNADHEDADMTMDDLKEFLGEIDKMHLLEKTAAERNTLLLERLKEERKSKLMSKTGSILYKRFPVVDPNDFFDRIHPYIKWIWSPVCFGFMTLVILTAGVTICYHWDEFTDGIKAVFSFQSHTTSSLIWLWLTILTVIGFHELGHGLTCKHYGGEVHEIGFLLMFFQPCLYANVTDSYMFSNKNHKLYVTFAGIIMEFFIGSLFCFVWVLTDTTTAFNALCYQAMTVCGISSILFNLNPLMKYDGYYAFSEWLDVPNLKQNSGDALENWFKKIYKRKTDEEEDDGLSNRERKIYVVYALIASLYILSMMAGLLYMLKDTILEKFSEIGFLVYAFVVYKLMNSQITAVGKFVKDFYKYECGAFGAVKVRVVLLVMAAFLVGLCFTVPYRLTIDKEVKIEAVDRWAVHAPVEGYMEEVYVKTGDEVKPGDDLFLIANPDQSKKLADLSATAQTYQMQRDQALATGDFSKLQDIRIQESQSANDRAAILQNLEKMKTVSPAKGLVLTDKVQELRGKYFNKGDKIFEIVSLDNLYSVIQLEEKEAGMVRDARSAALRPSMADAALPPSGRSAGAAMKPTHARVKVKALPHRLFEGSVLAVDSIGDTSGLTPKFRAKIAIPNPDIRPGQSITASIALRPGMTGIAKLDIETATPFKAFTRWLTGFFRLDLFMY